MKKNKLLGLAIAAMISMSSVVPAFAADTVSQEPTTTEATVAAKQANEAEKLAKLTERATKLGIDITGLTSEQAREKIKESVALKFGVDITGLSKEEAKAKLKETRETKKAAITEKISEKAAKLGIDTTGSTNKEIKEKIKAAREAKTTSAAV